MFAPSPLGTDYTAHSQRFSSSVTDLNSLQKIKQLAGSDESAAFEKVAQQFESFLVRSLMKNMRQSVQAFSNESYLNGPKVAFYQEMLDDQLAVTLSEQGGIGLAEQMHRQLFERYGSLSSVNNVEDMQQDHDRMTDRATTSSTSRVTESVSIPGEETNKPALYQNMSATSLPDRPDFDSPESFLQTLYPEAIKAAKALGVDPEVLLAQAALETGWGEHMIRDEKGQSSNNLFGIKADSRWHQNAVSVTTHEYVDGRPIQVKAKFRQYSDFSHSFSDYVKFIKQQPRYAPALANASNSYRYAQALQDAGYATDPKYAEKIMNIVERITYRVN